MNVLNTAADVVTRTAEAAGAVTETAAWPPARRRSRTAATARKAKAPAGK
jgi:hypothetical protein